MHVSHFLLILGVTATEQKQIVKRYPAPSVEYALGVFEPYRDMLTKYVEKLLLDYFFVQSILLCLYLKY